MTVLVDATTAEHAVGIRTVTDGFLAGLANSALVADVVITVGPTTTLPLSVEAKRVALARTRPGRLVFQRFALPAYAQVMCKRDERPNTLLLLDAYAPIFRQRGLRYTAYVHDTLPLTDSYLWARSRRLPKSLGFASLRWTDAQLLTSSEHNADQIRHLLGAKAHVVPYGCGQLTDSQADGFLSRGPLPRANYILYIGALEERKNTETAIEAFKLARSSLPAGLSFVIVGRPRERYGQQIRDRIASLPASAGIRLLEKVDRVAAVDLIGRAAALVFPSRAEGFGLPVLEALASGTPVVASDIPEISSWAGSTVSYVPPTDASGMAAAIIATLTGDGPSARAGQELAAGYRWKTFADAALAFTREAAV